MIVNAILAISKTFIMKKIQSLFLPAVAAGIASIALAGIACADTLYVSNYGSDTIAIINAGVTTTFGSSSDLNGPMGLAFDPLNGNLFVANATSGNIAEFTANGTLITSTYATGLANPKGLAFDSAGNLYVAENTPGLIEKILPGINDLSGGAASTFASNLNGPTGIAFDSVGNLFVTNQTGESVTIITPGGIPAGNVFITGPQLNMPHGIAFDSNGNVFVVNQGNATVEEIKAGGIGSIFASGGMPRGDVFDSAGNLYVTDISNGTVTEYNSLGGLVTTYSTNGCDPVFITNLPGDLPVPEPSTCALLTAGAAMLFLVGRRKMARVRA